MNTFLFVWNPKRYTWHDIENNIQQITNEGKTSVRWSCGVNKSIRPNDRMFLVKIRTEPKGIVAAGYVTTPPFPDKHWNGENKEALFVRSDLEVLLNPDFEPILTLDILKISDLAAQNWTPQASGISIRPELVDELEAVWFDFLATSPIRHNPFLPSEHQHRITYTEGTPT